MPRLMRVYGLKPWELPLLTGGELSAVVDDYRAITEVPDG